MYQPVKFPGLKWEVLACVNQSSITNQYLGLKISHKGRENSLKSYQDKSLLKWNQILLSDNSAQLKGDDRNSLMVFACDLHWGDTSCWVVHL